MEVSYHPLVKRDVVEILRYYQEVSPKLAADFHEELEGCIERIATSPTRFPPVESDFRRANLTRFPYHILYEVHPDGVRVMLVRHHKRHPDYGRERK